MAHKLTIPIFERSDYSFWKVQMRGYLISLGYNTWKEVETKYVQPTNGLTTPDEIQAYAENEKASYAIFSALSKIELTNIILLNTAYEVQENLRDIYEENDRVKLSKRLTTKCRYENSKEGEDIINYFQKVDSAVNEIKELCSTLIDEDIIENILMLLPKTYNDKISVIEETYYSKKFTREHLYGTLSTFQIRKFGKGKAKSKFAFQSYEEDPKDKSLDAMKT